MNKTIRKRKIIKSCLFSLFVRVTTHMHSCACSCVCSNIWFLKRVSQWVDAFGLSDLCMSRWVDMNMYACSCASVCVYMRMCTCMFVTCGRLLVCVCVTRVGGISISKRLGQVLSQLTGFLQPREVIISS